MNGSSAAHTKLVKEILVALGSLPGVIIGLNPSGRAKYVSERTGKVFFTPCGWPTAEGGPDLLAVVAPLGRLVAIEVKTGNAAATPEQLACLRALRAVGVRCAVVRSVAEARAALEGALWSTPTSEHDSGPFATAEASQVASSRRAAPPRRPVRTVTMGTSAVTPSD